MPLEVKLRKETKTLTIVGTVANVRVRQRAQTNDIKLAREEAAALEAQLLRDAWHGPRTGIRSFASSVKSYLDHEPRSAGTQAYLVRIMHALGDVKLHELDQEAVDRIRLSVLRSNAAPSTVLRSIVTPLRAVMRHAHKRGWCDPVSLEAPGNAPEGRTAFMTPAQVESLQENAAPHLRPLIAFLACTGARMSEALELDWDSIDLAGARATFWKTKSGKRRVANLVPRAIKVLTGLGHREGAVFRTGAGTPYATNDRQYGGQIKTAWKAALRRAELPSFTPHELRHTFASWHYALHKDLLALKVEGGWSSVDQVERYAHLATVNLVPDIERFWLVGSGNILQVVNGD